MPEDFAVTQFWRVLSGQAPGRTGAGQITIFDSVGFALEDYSALRYMRDQAQNLGYGKMIGLVPDLEDPKNVFGLIRTRSEANGSDRSEEHTSELQSLMRISYAVFCLQKK